MLCYNLHMGNTQEGLHMTREKLFANIAEIAADAYDDSDADEVQSWDAYEAAKQIVAAMQAFGYDITDMLEQIEEDADEA